ncbi:MAG: hypothetical protein QXO15_06725 [Nitrososphaerota archaeon]
MRLRLVELDRWPTVKLLKSGYRCGDSGWRPSTYSCSENSSIREKILPGRLRRAYELMGEKKIIDGLCA